MENILAGAWDQQGVHSAELQRIQRRKTGLWSERSTWEPTWRDISTYIQPRRGRFFTEDKNKGDRKDLSIINNRATRASRIKSAGLMSGLTNPAHSWFRYTAPDPDLNEFEPVQHWLSQVVERTLWVFARSNVYLALHGIYSDLDFGTGAMHVDEDQEKVLRAYLYPIGSYALANSHRLRVDTAYREFQMTAAQLVDKFGEQKCSLRAREAAKNAPDAWFSVTVAIEPNAKMKPGHLDWQGKPYVCHWLEQGADAKDFLLVEGYNEFPVMAPRWEVNGEDIYGRGPGHEAIGDAKALQTLERRKAQFIDKLANPAMQLPSSLRNEPVSMNPNSHLYVDGMGPAQAVRPVYEPNPQGLIAIEESIRQHEMRIDQAYGTDVWAMFANDPTGKMTATEVLQRKEEKMLLLGPYLQRLEEELLDPLLERTFGIILRAGLLPPPPKELQGQELKVEYQSTLAQAQKLMGIQGVRELVAFTSSIAQMQAAAGQPVTALDKLDTDQIIDDYADRLGVPPELVVDDEQVAGKRAQRAKAEQAKAAAEQMQQAAEVAKTASGADLEGDNVLSRMLPAVVGRQ